MILNREFRAGKIRRVVYCTDRRLLLFKTKAGGLQMYHGVPVELFRSLPTGSTFGVWFAEKLNGQYAVSLPPAPPSGMEHDD